MNKLIDVLKLCDGKVEIAFGNYTSCDAFVSESGFLTLNYISDSVVNSRLLQMPVTRIITQKGNIRIYVDNRRVQDE